MGCKNFKKNKSKQTQKNTTAKTRLNANLDDHSIAIDFLNYLAVGIHVVVCLRWIDLRQQESSLRSTLLGIDVPWHWETRLQNLLSIINWGLEGSKKISI